MSGDVLRLLTTEAKHWERGGSLNMSSCYVGQVPHPTPPFPGSLLLLELPLGELIRGSPKR